MWNRSASGFRVGSDKRASTRPPCSSTSGSPSPCSSYQVVTGPVCTYEAMSAPSVGRLHGDVDPPAGERNAEPRPRASMQEAAGDVRRSPPRRAPAPDPADVPGAALRDGLPVVVPLWTSTRTRPSPGRSPSCGTADEHDHGPAHHWPSRLADWL